MAMRSRFSGPALALAVLILAAGADGPRGRESFSDPEDGKTNGPDAGVPSVDLRPDFQEKHLEARSQGGRGTCSAFAMTGAIEYAVSKARPSAKPPRLSVEFLNWASNQATGTAVDGGFFTDLWKGMLRHGICPEEDMPYANQFSPSARPSQTAIEHARPIRNLGLRIHWIKEWNPKKGLSDGQLGEIKRTLRNGWPVCGGFLWPKRARWEQNILQMCPRAEVFDGHSVLLVGYRDDPSLPGGGVFLIRNSGGSSRDGLLSYEYVKAYMNDAAWVDGGPGHTGQMTQIPSHDLLSGLLSPPRGRSRRISSNQQPRWHDDNLDMTWLEPGQVLELPRLEGPGLITHIWFTSHAGWVNELNALSIRIYWDDRQKPGVEAPLGDFFAVGQGKPAVVESVPVQVSSTGALTCFWRMPFARSARIVIRNDHPDRGAGLYWQVDWTKLDALPAETPYFHARYRQDYPAPAGRDYLIADLAGRGRYIGTVLSVTLAQDGWFGEGDDFFYVDGEKVPSLQGTGSEDYFNDAWGFRPRTGHWFGQPRWQGDRAGDSGVCYRWHVLDPIDFQKSLQVAIEHKGNYENDLDGFYLERPDFLSSVAFWYQTGEPKRAEPLPPWPKRRVPWQQQLLVRSFRQAQVSRKELVKPTVQAQGLFGARPVLYWGNGDPGARLTVPFSVAEEGRHAVRLTALQGPQFGRYEIAIDGHHESTVDFHSEREDELDFPVCTRQLSRGNHELTFAACSVSTTDLTTARPMAVEALRMLKLPPPATRPVKNQNEAHFIRLGIGRSLYAYRLAYGELPGSLEKAVESGIMPPRYLKDENGRLLKSWREGDDLTVESPMPGGWKHRWRGLDPRR